jgi:chromosome segregation ATPase
LAEIRRLQSRAEQLQNEHAHLNKFRKEIARLKKENSHLHSKAQQPSKPSREITSVISRLQKDNAWLKAQASKPSRETTRLLSRLQKENAQLKSKAAALGEAGQGIQSANQQLQSKSDRLEEEIGRLKSQVALHQKKYAHLKVQGAKPVQANTQLRSALAQLQKENNRLTTQLHRLGEQTSWVGEKRHRLQEQSTALQAQAAELKSENSHLGQENGQLQAQVQQFKKQIIRLQVQSHRPKEQNRRLHEQSQLLQKQTARLQKDNIGLSAQNARLSEQMASLSEETKRLKQGALSDLSMGSIRAAKSSPSSIPLALKADDPLLYFVHDVHERGLPRLLQSALLDMVVTGQGLWQVNNADLQNADSDLRRYFGRVGTPDLARFVATSLADYVQKFGMRLSWEENEHLAGAGQKLAVSMVAFRLREGSSLPERRRKVQALLDGLEAPKQDGIHHAINTLSSNLSQNFGYKGAPAAARCRDLVLKGRRLEIAVPKPAALAAGDISSIWSPPKRLQFLLGGFEQAMGLRLRAIWRETPTTLKLELQSTQTREELDRSVCEHLLFDTLHLVPPSKS